MSPTAAPASAIWRPRLVHDLMFQIDGFGWHVPELRDGIGYRWSGPGRLAGLRIPFRSAAPGRGEVHVFAIAGAGGTAGLEMFLNGHPLTLAHRAEGGMGVVEFAWPAAVVAGREVAEIWIVAPEMITEGRPSQDAPEGRRLGVAVSCVVLEPGAPDPAAAQQRGTDATDALPLLLGRRWLARHLTARAERADFVLDEDGRGLTVRLGDLRLAAVSLPQLVWHMRMDGEGGLRAVWQAEDNPCLPPGAAVAVAAPSGEPLDGLAGLPVFDQIAIAALLRDTAAQFGRWLARGGAAIGPGQEPAALARWHAALGAAHDAAGRSLAMLATAEADLFALLARIPAGSIFARPARAGLMAAAAA